MKPTRSLLKLVIGMAAALTLALTGGSPAAATATPGTTSTTDQSTWELVDHGPNHRQRICVAPNSVRTHLYYLFTIDGARSAPVEAGLSGLPAGSEVWPTPTVAPGGNRYTDLLMFDLAPTPAGRYTPTIWASDGVVTQTVPVILDFEAGCH